MDFTLQIRRVKELLAGLEEKPKTITAAYDLEEIRRKTGLAEKGKARPSIVPAEDVAVELGPPDMNSLNLVMWTGEKDLVDSGRVSIVGPDITETPDRKMPFGQIVMLYCPDDENLNVFDVETTQFLANRLPGYMVRMVPGRLWARISRELHEKGFNLGMLGSILIHDYIHGFSEIDGAEALFITSASDCFEKLKPVAAEAKIISGKNTKLKAVGDAEFECEDLTCDTCDEKPVCDSIRDIIILRRKQRTTEGPEI